MKKGIKDFKFPIILLVACAAVALIVGIIVGGAPQRHNDSLKKTLLETMTPIAKECGLENLEVVYVDDQYSVKVVLACDNMSTISYDKKTKFFDDAAEAISKKGTDYEFYKTGKVAVYSDGNRYTASADTLTSRIYENGTVIDPETNAIKIIVETPSSSSSSSSSSSKKNSSSSSSSSSKTVCKGGVSCRAGFHRCNPHSKTGYCRSCCKD